MIGHLLGGRYEILERIGGGGMALVYKAHDVLLNRNVAVKVLRQQFVHDEEFIRRFRREAQSAASLSHPNVVSIYDVGQEDEIHYIVMECVEGQNLNEIIKERAPLQVDEAVRIAMQICDALEHAHHHQIIHRDIKPHNILIGRNGRVKVTDFGIARAVTSTTITQTGSVVGSVHYFSPEHAKGITTGEKSDLYSLGIVLYQMLTAQLPFLGESPISVALKHLQEPFEEPRRVNPLIPQSVENIILKSMRKNPQERYQSAEEMLMDLETCLLPERRDEPKIDFSEEDDADQTRVIPAIKPEPQGAAFRGNEQENPSEPDAAVGAASPGQRKSNKKRNTIIITVILLILAAMGGLAWYVSQAFEVDDVKVPKVIGMTEDQARMELGRYNLTVGEPVLKQYKEGVPAGVVFDQDKEPDSTVKEGTIVKLSVSIDKPLSTMIDVKGKTYEEAVQLLTEQGIEESRITRKDEYSDQEPGTVITQTPGVNEEYDKDNADITLVVSKGVESVRMPGLIGKTRDEAEKLIKDAGLKLGDVKEEYSYSSDAGKVTQQWPYNEGADVQPGSEVTLTVSSGYPPEALEFTLSVPAAPAEEGKSSKIRITYSDARGDNQEWGTRTIKSTQTFPVTLLLGPNKDGTISVFREGQFIDTYPVRYIDAKNGTVEQPQLPQTNTDTGSEATPPEDQPTSGNANTGKPEEPANNGEGNNAEPAGKGKGKDKGKSDKKDKASDDNINNDNTDSTQTDDTADSTNP
ncbi:Stk1 family PASTA domain-containing Ser/Thr kinase [Paenibacillus sp. JX-17]|uniref:non-specific serine/threonine protein kinase n=1 Tax=Paenibacillus lacisoli TaxID=3064525 RepID=A0ABT9C9A1_9BACL|nr:Stk1 family PASTA domain-containing Ser/Thr kinase [Paenibacillus sp. JX-17]MDO7905244.1 Stk1 family PASTA domain-containing Ser/Thr kinase [Paenibacillus sp. JX-17]